MCYLDVKYKIKFYFFIVIDLVVFIVFKPILVGFRFLSIFLKKQWKHFKKYNKDANCFRSGLFGKEI